MIVKLPSKRAVIIDAKVPLQAFLEALETDNEDLKREKLKNHALQVRAHIEKLSRKEYWSQFEDVPEFVFAFIPGESIYSSALQQDPSLIEFGVGKNVILATPTSLINLLRVLAQGWREAQLAESAKEISAQGSLIYERLTVFANHFVSLKSAVEKSVETFNSAASSLETRVLPAARKMKELGIAGTVEIPPLEQIDKLVPYSPRTCHPETGNRWIPAPTEKVGNRFSVKLLQLLKLHSNDGPAIAGSIFDNKALTAYLECREYKIWHLSLYRDLSF